MKTIEKRAIIRWHEGKIERISIRNVYQHGDRLFTIIKRKQLEVTQTEPFTYTVCAEEVETQASTDQEPTSAYVKVMINLNNIKNNADLEKIRAVLTPGALFEPFEGLNWLITRYPSRVLADARALDAECAAYCGRAEIEESWCYRERQAQP